MALLRATAPLTRGTDERVGLLLCAVCGCGAAARLPLFAAFKNSHVALLVNNVTYPYVLVFINLIDIHV